MMHRKLFCYRQNTLRNAWLKTIRNDVSSEFVSFSGVKPFWITPNRAKFLELAADSVAADSLYLVPEDGGGSRLEMGQYKERQSHLSLLGKMWFMSDRVKQFQVRLAFSEYDCIIYYHLVISLLNCPKKS